MQDVRNLERFKKRKRKTDWKEMKRFKGETRDGGGVLKLGSFG